MRRSFFHLRWLTPLLLLSMLAAGVWGGAGLSARAAPVQQAVANVVISNFRFDGPNGGNDEFIELHNQTGTQANISGWKIWGSNNSGGTGTTPRYTFPSNTFLQPGQYYLITNNSTPGYSGIVPGDATYSSGITEDGGIALTLPNNAVVDAVGLSSGSAYLEGIPLTRLSGNNDQGYARQGGGCQDTNNNAADFGLQSPSNPQNTTSIPIKCLRVINVTSSTPNGTYTSTGSPAIAITVEFSSNVNVTGAPTLLIETGMTDRVATYVSGNGSTILTFNYVVQAGDVSADLDYVAANSLSLNGGTITGAVGDADLTLPSPGAAGSLGSNKDIVIDNQAAPVLMSFKRYNPTASLTYATILVFRATFSEPVKEVDISDFSAFTTDGSVVATVTNVVPSSPSSVYDITVSVAVPPGLPINVDVGLNLNNTQNITDAVNTTLPNGEPATDEIYTLHLDSPTGTITKATGQADPARGTPVNFTVTFSEPIDASKFTTSDVTQKGTALVNAWNVVDSGDHTNFVLSATAVSTNGTIIPSIAIGRIEDLAGNPNTVEIVGDSVVFQDNIQPAVTINQADGQADPTNTLPVRFTVIFSEPIIPSIFTPGDISQSGTATGITWNITDSGDHKTFTLSATKVTGYGTLIPSIAANRVTDLVGNNNLASTGTDNRVDYLATRPLIVVINEVAWAGTQARSEDEWIELYNPGNQDIDLTGWNLLSADGSPNIKAGFNGIVIGAGEYLLLEHGDGADSDATDVVADLTYSGSLSNAGEILRLYDPNGTLIDTANVNGGAWPAGILSTYSSMQRSVIAADSDYVWVTYDVTKDTNTSITKAKDALGNLIKGTPGRANTPINVTPTPTPRNTPIPGSTIVGGVVIPPVIGISEFLPRPGYDWNNDGLVDVYDEFIEIINAGPIDINLSSYQLDDEQGKGSRPYILPNRILKPDERAVFYASETGILLSDGGDTVRLLRGSTVVDAYTYSVVRYPDQSWCRIPDRMGYWNDPCFPTPNNPNALTGTIPAPSKPVGYRPPVCLLPDTTPEEFVYAECETSGDGIWNRRYWDEADVAERRKLDEDQKWETVFE
jgi:hypothetical protein